MTNALKLFLLLSPLFFSSNVTLASEFDIFRSGLQTLKEHTDWTWEEAISGYITDFENARFESTPSKNLPRYILSDLKLHQWGQKISETQGLFAILFSFKSEVYQEQNQRIFKRAMKTIDRFRNIVNKKVEEHHPGFDLKSPKLRENYSGKGIKIVVFDVFDQKSLSRQRDHYPLSKIEVEQRFGDPVELNHGNSVIDVILAIAPAATIIPVSAESKSYNLAMKYILERSDVQIVNMSRAFAQQGDILDQVFSKILKQILEEKIVTKSLGNTGTDLDGKTTPLREGLGLESTGNLFSYDLSLIQEFIRSKPEDYALQNLMMTINLDSFSENIALSATIPGDNIAAAKLTYAIPADSVYSWSTGNFESGSSFAAPQLAAICALLWDFHESQINSKNSNVAETISQALRSSVRASKLGSFNVGNGLIDGDSAANLLK